MRHRRLNRAIVWLRLAARKLEAQPVCEVCEGAPAVETHRPDGCFAAATPAHLEALTTSDVRAVCEPCHDDTGCTVHRSVFDRLPGFW